MLGFVCDPADFFRPPDNFEHVKCCSRQVPILAATLTAVPPCLSLTLPRYVNTIHLVHHPIKSSYRHFELILGDFAPALLDLLDVPFE